ncbi:MAG: MaoC family dehydratase, partial [Ilumatobacter sp.]
MTDSVIDWVITDTERARFARFSGDHNPVHTDPVAARRLRGGRLLVHGAHLLLGVVEQATTAGFLDATPGSVDVRFLHGVEPGAPLETTLHASDGAVRATVTTDVWRAVEVTIAPGRLLPSSDELHGC